MALDAGVRDWVGEPVAVEWDSTSSLVYSLGVGAGADPRFDELAFTTENTAGVSQQVLPTFPLTFGYVGPRVPYGDIDRTKLVHAQQAVELLAPIPTSGTGSYGTRVTGVFDKGSGALVTTESLLSGDGGEPLARMRGGSFIRGEGGFGGERGESPAWHQPDRPADEVLEQATAPWQALLFRLSGDRNPLHSDPHFAAAGGFDRPILHGMCTYGFVARALLHTVVAGDTTRFRDMSARFTAPVLPGETLRTSIWVQPDEVLFETRTAADRPVLSLGRAHLDAAA